MPEVPEAVAHLIEYLFEVGPACGEHEVTYGEIRAWCEVSGTVVNEFQAAAIRMLSKTYLSMLHRASDAKCPAPIARRAIVPASKEEISNALAAGLRSLRAPEGKPKRRR